MAGHLINDKPNSSSGGDGNDEWHIDQHFECGECEHSQTMEVPLTADFFWPDR